MAQLQALDVLADPLRQHNRLALIGCRQQHDELLAAIACRQVAGTLAMRHEHRRHLAQALVTERMAIAVVDALEVIDVGQQHCQRAAAAAGTANLLVQHAVEAPAVGQLGQRVGGAQAQQFSEKKLESFAESLGEIMQIREEFTGKLQQTEDANKARDLQQQANEKMLGVIEENNISIEEYNAINEAVQTDPELRNRVIAMMQ